MRRLQASQIISIEIFMGLTLIVAILLLDPTPTFGHELWGGSVESISRGDGQAANSNRPSGTCCSLFERIVAAQTSLSVQDLNAAWNHPKLVALPAFQYVIADWLLLIEYMKTQIGKMEWELERPHWGERLRDIENLLRKRNPWKRNIGHYQEMLRSLAEALFEHPANTSVTSGLCPTSIRALQRDVQRAERRMGEVRQKLERLQEMANSSIAIEESRRAIGESRENQGTARLTRLATIFLPLNFATSFLSMSSDFSIHNNTFKLFFIISTIVMVVISGWLSWINRGWCRRLEHWGWKITHRTWQRG